jgi:hypothetical protein
VRRREKINPRERATLPGIGERRRIGGERINLAYMVWERG